MKKRIFPVYGRAEIITAMLYLCSISAVMMYALCRSYVVICTAAMTLCSCGIFMLFYKLRKKRLVSFLTFVALLAAVAGICSAVTAVKGRVSIVRFIYLASDEYDNLLAVAVIALFSFVMAYPVFYFTVRLPRPCFLLLPAMAPLILCARTVGAIPAGYVVFIAVGYFAAVMGVSRAEYAKDTYVDDKRSRYERLAAMGIFAAAAAVILAIVPRDDYTRYARYLNRRMWEGASFFGTGGQMGGFSQSSVPNTGNNDAPDNLLFYVTTDNPQNIISQSFDRYMPKRGWTYVDDFTTGYADWRRKEEGLDYSGLAYRLEKAVEDGKLADYAEEISALSRVYEKETGGSVMNLNIADGSNSNVVRHPNGTYDVQLYGNNLKTYKNPVDEIFTKEPFGRNPTYTLRYYKNVIKADIARYFSGLPKDDYFNLLEQAAAEDVISNREMRNLENAFENAENYAVTTFDETITPRIQALADEITAGLDNDYDKAVAIEQWFGKEKFIYDLNFIPQETGAEYFIFQSKRGICTDFATASTLLLRAAGVSARYTEGFLLATDAEHTDRYGRYEVYANQAHAFASAFVPGAGWVEVDGTKYAIDMTNNKDRQRTIFICAVAAGVVVTVCIVFRKRISDVLFAVRYRLLRGSRRVRALYIKLRKIASSISGVPQRSLTTGEVRRAVGERLRLDREAGEITYAADALFYGGCEPNFDNKRLFECYKTVLKASRKYKKSKKRKER